MIRTILLGIVFPIVSSIIANFFPVANLTIKQRLAIGSVLMILMTAGLLFLERSEQVTVPTTASEPAAPAAAHPPPAVELPHDAAEFLTRIWNLHRPMLLRYTPFRFTTWMYDDSTFAKWYGLGFIVYAVRVVLCVPAILLDVLALALLAPPALLEATIGITARNLHFGLIVLLLVTEMIMGGRVLGPLSAITAIIFVSSLTVQAAIVAIPGRIAYAIFGIPWWIVVPATLLLIVGWQDAAKKYHRDRVRHKWALGTMPPVPWWADVVFYAPTLWPYTLLVAHKVAVTFEAGDAEDIRKMMEALLTAGSKDPARKNATEATQ